MKKAKINFIFILTIFLMFTGTAFALRVAPGAFCAQGVDIGEDLDLGIDVVVDNDMDKEMEFSLKVTKPEMPADKSLSGYSEIPDLSWFYLEKEKIVVPAKGQGKSRMHINIPKGDKYYNQHWAVSCLIEYAERKGQFQEAISTIYMIETRSKANPAERPYGKLGVAPSVVKIKGKSGMVSFKIYNNAPISRLYKVKTLIPEIKKGSLIINSSKGFEWAESASWIKPTVERIWLAKGESKEINLRANLPEGLDLENKGVEALVFVESNRGERNFVRVWVTEEQKSASKGGDQAKEM